MAGSVGSQWERRLIRAANMRRFAFLLAAAVLLAPAPPADAQSEASPTQGETVAGALCRLIEGAAIRHGLPVEFFTRLIWQESSFRTDAVSSKGAQGLAQFMPGTAAERGLADPFDPETALPASAALLDELRRRFGNLGLAAAAYTAGPARVERWLAGRSGLPLETQDYLLFVTGQSAEKWAEARAQAEGAGMPTPASMGLGTSTPATARPTSVTPVSAPQGRATPGLPAATAASPTLAAFVFPATDCLSVTAALRRGGGEIAQEIATVTAPWGVQLSGNFSKARALASYQRTQKRFAALLLDTQPMIIGTRLRSRGSRAFYRVRVGAPTRAAAIALCNRLRAAGGACIVLPS